MVCDVDEALRMRVPKVALVRRAEVDLVLAQRRLDPVREHARRETRDDLAHARLVRGVQHVVVDVDVVAQHRQLVLHVHEQAPDCQIAHANQCSPPTFFFLLGMVHTEGREMDDMRRLVFCEERLGRLGVATVGRERQSAVIDRWMDRWMVPRGALAHRRSASLELANIHVSPSRRP